MRTTPLARRLGSMALVAAVTLGLAACSSGEDDGAKESSSSSSSDDGAGADSGSDAEAEPAASELGASEFYPAVMAALREAETFKFTTTTKGEGTTQKMKGEARWGDEGIAMKATGTGAQPMDMIMLDQVIYMKSPDFNTGDKWLKIDLGASEDSLMGMLGKAADPEVMFKAMEKPKSVELIGEEEVDGVATNHYRITIDPEAYMEAMEFPAEMASYMPEELVTEMWVDADDLPRKFLQTMESPAGAGGPASSSTSEGTYSDFGTDVDIQAPAESEISEQVPGGV